ncbi:hypothetical protein [Catenovulum maritimum]|uniref:Right handed beta helix domain-containing protein n=1 Tax=Catenovulum maritimum TaxID=1513271 RepID=A0A0J8GTD7_9ALTE|nr:hypothetical protein [Catenovulum maritimum]KMT64564.1 hypothetical protein XM47_14020 [Catenovulum maritimum]
MKHIIKTSLLTGLLSLSASAIAGGTLTISNQTGTIVIDDNNDYDEIVIPAGKTLQANIQILKGRTNDVVIRGNNRSTSIIAPNGLFGESQADAKGVEGKKLSSIYADCNCTVSISKLTSRNPEKFHILGDTDNSVMLVDNVNIYTRIASGSDVHHHHTTDGFGGGIGSSIRNSVIDTFDDSVKVYRTEMTVENLKIYHNEFGAPYQFGWGGFNYAKLIAKGTNTVVDNDSSYRHGVFGWVKTNEPGLVRKVDFRGTFNHNVASGKTRSDLYTFGHLSNSANKVTGATLNLFGSKCKASTSTNTSMRQGSSLNITNGTYCS